MLLTRSPLTTQEQAPKQSVRLACVKHAASVRPEPGSNSPNKKHPEKPTQPTSRNQPARQAIPTKKQLKTKKQASKKDKHAIEFTNNTHTTPTAGNPRPRPVISAPSEAAMQAYRNIHPCQIGVNINCLSRLFPRAFRFRPAGATDRKITQAPTGGQAGSG